MEQTAGPVRRRHFPSIGNETSKKDRIEHESYYALRGGKIMDKERLRSIVSALGSCELTYLEKLFVGRVQEHFEGNWVLTEQQESILEGIYREKVRRIKKRSRQAEDCLAKSSV